MYKTESYNPSRREFLGGLVGAIGSAALEKPLAYAAEFIGGKEYIAYFGKFGNEPFALLEKPSGFELNIDSWGITKKNVSYEEFQEYLKVRGMQKVGQTRWEARFLPQGVNVYSLLEKYVELQFPEGSREKIKISDPFDAQSGEGNDGQSGTDGGPGAGGSGF